MRSVRLVQLGLVLAGALTASVAKAAVSQQRIAAVDNSERVRMTSGVSPKLSRATVLGDVSGDMKLPSMTISFTLSDAQQSELTTLLGQLQDPNSPKYHQWLTPEQFNAEFGMSSADIAQVKTWLASQGFTVTEVARGGQFVRFSGTAAQAQAAFQTQLERVTVDGETHFANVSAPSLPAAIASVAMTVTGLDDFHPKPHVISRVVAAQKADPLHPDFTSPISGNHYLAPGDMYTMYDVNGLLSSSVNGTGVNIAVVGQTDVTLANITNFRSVSGLSVNTPTVKLYGSDPGVPSANDVLESTLDLEWSGCDGAFGERDFRELDGRTGRVADGSDRQ